MKKTAQFGLNQWEMSDRIQMQDFNRDNAAIEAALAKRNCRFYTASYTGDGEATKTWTFPAKPIMVLIIGKSISAFIQDFPIGITQFGSGSTKITATWHENSVTWSANSHDSYGLFAILEA